MTNQTLKKTIKCPTCGKGKILAGEAATGIVSIQCPRCGHIFQADLTTLQAIEARAQRNI